MSHREPIFNVPRIVVWLLAAFLAVHMARQLLPDQQSASPSAVLEYVGHIRWLAGLLDRLPDSGWVLWLLAFVPARLGGLAPELPGGYTAAFTSFVTHLFVHADLTHLLVNSAWFLAFATAIARRTNVWRFLAFFTLTGIAGALFFTAVHGFELTRLVGASGAISGLMGAAFRFIFARDEHGRPHLGDSTRVAPLMSLFDTMRDRRIVMAIAGWVVLNILVAWGAAYALAESLGIAWEAHLGGFAAGLLVYGFFDQPPAIHHDANGDAAGAE